MKIILLGAPGSGKGTLAKKITEDFNLPQISTGDLFRTIAKEDTPFAKSVQEIMKSGGLVPDEVTVEIVKKRISEDDCKNGFILDGFPRTINQAQQLEKISNIDSVILLEIEDDVVVDRLSSRRTCPNCGAIYNIHDYSKYNCIKCFTRLIQRDDDKPETILNRLEVYKKNTAPLINFYSEKLFRVSNGQTPDETYKPVKAFLQNWEAQHE